MKDFIAALCLFIISITLYTLTLRGALDIPDSHIKMQRFDQATKPFESSQERNRYLLTETLINKHTFAVPENIVKQNPSDIGYYNGKYFILFPPGISILIIPLYLLGHHFALGQVFSFFTIAIFASLTLLFTFKIARNIFNLSVAKSLLTAGILGFATSSWSYAITLYQHQVTLFFIMSSFYAAWKYKQHTKPSFLWAAYIWFSYGVASFLDYPNLLLLLPVLIYFFINSLTFRKINEKIRVSFRISFLATMFIAIILFGIHGFYNYKTFGSPTKISQSLVNYKTIEQQHLLTKQNGKNIIKSTESKKNPVHFLSEEKVPHGLGILLFGLDRSLFIYSPMLLLSLFGLYKSFKKNNNETIILLSIVLIDLFIYSSFDDPWGGWSFGPRYLIPTIGILSLYAGFAITQIKRLFFKIGVLVLFAYSLALSLLGALTTNQIPPQVEGEYLHIKYTFLRNFDYFMKGSSSSFLYNDIFKHYLSLQQYYLLLYVPLLIIGGILLFYTSRKELNEN